MRPGLKGFVSVLVAGSMFVSSTGAVAATSSTPVAQIDPWAALAVMSGGASAATMCGAAAAVAAAQPAAGCVLPVVDQPPPVAAAPPPQPIPVPPVEPVGGLGISPLLLGLAAVAAGVGLYFLLKGDGNGNGNSPN